MKAIKLFLIFFFLFKSNLIFANELEFDNWLIDFKNVAINSGISKNTVDIVLLNVQFIPKVIEYDRYQPEHYEDTKTYISKRTSTKKVKTGKSIYNFNKKTIDNVENLFNVEKELLLALMGIETNFGRYLGKMDIISS